MSVHLVGTQIHSISRGSSALRSFFCGANFFKAAKRLNQKNINKEISTGDGSIDLLSCEDTIYRRKFLEEAFPEKTFGR